MSGPYRGLQEEAWAANVEIPKYGLAVFTWGNVSAFDSRAGVFAIKPSGVPYDELKPEDMVVLDLEGNVVEGKLRPSSDTPTHRCLYRSFQNLGGIVHTHSPYATAWAQTLKPIPVYGTTHADHSPAEIPCTPVLSRQAVQGDYEWETGLQILEVFRERDPQVTPMVLLGGHAPFAWGASAKKAFYNAVVLEEVARMAFFTILGGGPSTPHLPDYLIKKHFERKHGPNAYYGQKS